MGRQTSRTTRSGPAESPAPTGGERVSRLLNHHNPSSPTLRPPPPSLLPSSPSQSPPPSSPFPPSVAHTRVRRGPLRSTLLGVWCLPPPPYSVFARTNFLLPTIWLASLSLPPTRTARTPPCQTLILPATISTSPQLHLSSLHLYSLTIPHPLPRGDVPECCPWCRWCRSQAKEGRSAHRCDQQTDEPTTENRMEVGEAVR